MTKKITENIYGQQQRKNAETMNLNFEINTNKT